MNLRTIAFGSGLVIAAAFSAALLIGPRNGVSSTSEELPRVVTVTGQGEVKRQPDMAIVTTGVTSEAVNAQDALSKNNAAMASVINALKAAGIEDDDIQTSNFSVSPQYPPYQPGQTTAPRISSYQVSNQVTFKIKKLKALGSVLDALVRAGSNQISGISFDLQEPGPALNDARKKAVADAKAKAELYVSAAEASLGKVVQISEVSAVVPQHYKGRTFEATSADASVPIAVGQNSVTANITITYEIR